MSHFTVMIFGNNPEEQLAQFDENIEMPRYVKYTKPQLIEKAKRDMEEYKAGGYASFLADPEEYKKHSNPQHIDYLENEFPKKFRWSDEEFYADAIDGYEPEQIGPFGELYSTRNPKSQWDWCELGGRWAGTIKLKEGIKRESDPNFSWGWDAASKAEVETDRCDQALKKDIANLDEILTFAVIKEGEWYEKGSMGWWGMVSDEKENGKWEEEFKKLLASVPDDMMISIYDCHI